MGHLGLSIRAVSGRVFGCRRALIALALAGALVGCGDEESTVAGEGGETTSGGEVASSDAPQSVQAPPGSRQPEDDGSWDGDEAGAGASADAGGAADAPAPDGQGGAAAEADDAAALWGSPQGQGGRPLPQRPEMGGSARGAFRDGLDASARGDLNRARQSFEQALSADARNYRAAYNLGVIADRAGNTGQAMDYYRRALRMQPDYEEAAEGIIRIHVRQGNVPDAVAFIEPLARTWERNLHLTALYAETLVHAKRYDKAMEEARKALARDERFVPAMVAIVKASLKQERGELAEAVLDQALAIDDQDAELHYLKASMLLKEDGRLREAMSELRKAVQLRPDYAEARIALGIQLLQGANYEEALQHFERAVQLVPTLVAVHLNLGDAYRANKRWTDAKQAFEKALSMDPNLAEAHFNLGLMYMTAGETFPGLDTLGSLRKASEEFEQYRRKMGPRMKRDDPSEAYLADLARLIDREERRIEREETRRRREAERAARQAAEGGGE